MVLIIYFEVICMTREQRIERTKQELYYLIAISLLDTVDPDLRFGFDAAERRLLEGIKYIYLAIDSLDISDETLDRIDITMKRGGLLDYEVTEYIDSLTEDQQKRLIEHVENYIRE